MWKHGALTIKITNNIGGSVNCEVFKFLNTSLHGKCAVYTILKLSHNFQINQSEWAYKSFACDVSRLVWLKYWLNRDTNCLGQQNNF